EQMGLRLLGEVEQRLGAGEAEFGLQVLGPGALAGAELAAITAGGAVAEAMRLYKNDIDAGLGQMRRRRQAGEAAADDDDIGAAVAVESRIGRPFAGRLLIPGISRRDRTAVGHGIGLQTFRSRYSRSHGLI